jgi:hypothetical protein
MISWVLLDVSSLTNLLSESTWQFIGIVSSFIISTITILIAIWPSQRRRKEISYRVISDVPILNTPGAFKDRINILFDGEPIRDASLLLLEVKNSGNVLVESRDFDPPIRFSFGERTLVSGDIADTQPKGLIDPQEVNVFLKQGCCEQFKHILSTRTVSSSELSNELPWGNYYNHAKLKRIGVV